MSDKFLHLFETQNALVNISLLLIQDIYLFHYHNFDFIKLIMGIGKELRLTQANKSETDSIYR